MLPIDEAIPSEPVRTVFNGLPAEIRGGLSRSVFGSLPDEVITRLMRDAMRLEMPTASIVFREGAPPSILLTLSGLIRIFLTSSAGRQSTVRYAKPGDLIGTPTLFVPQHRAGAQALTASVVLALNVDTIRHLATEDRRVALAVGADLAAQMQQYLDQLYGNAFGNLRQRVIRHLLEMAGQQGPQLVAPLSQQNLADAVGSVREVVARVLQALRKEQLVASTPDGIALLDPLRLHAEAWSREL
jgi:CRP/FNR family transcriptional regulator, cyclic AMP receptor protein